MVAHVCHPKKNFVSGIFLKKNRKRFKNKTITFISKTLSFRKCFLNKNIFVSKKMIFVSETLSLLFAN